MSTGYSGTPLVKKLGFRSGHRVHIRNAPEGYLQWLQPLPENLRLLKRLVGGLDAIHYFTDSRAKLESEIDRLIECLLPDGMIWISWPKKASKVETDMSEDVIREVALPRGLVDIKVCAVDSTWSGLKLVIRKELRPPTR